VTIRVRANEQCENRCAFVAGVFVLKNRGLPGAAPDQFDKPAGTADTRHWQRRGGQRRDAQAATTPADELGFRSRDTGRECRTLQLNENRWV
jgi:hypothetical protein